MDGGETVRALMLDSCRIGELGIFTNIDKALVIQDTKSFNETPLKNDRCTTVLTKLLYLLYQGERLSSKEATSVFFAVTKAFQSKEVDEFHYHCPPRAHPIASQTCVASSTWSSRSWPAPPKTSSWSSAALRRT